MKNDISECTIGRFSKEYCVPRSTVLALCCALTACEVPSEAVPLDASSGGKTIGLVLSGFDHLFNVYPDSTEQCPEGLVYSSKENWHVIFPTRAARKAHFDRCGGIDNRGPDCENVLAAPELARDPLPYREVKSPKSYGRNLDGTEDGRETATTCAHRKFVHPDGTKGIDNQYYRLLGCQKIVHSQGGFTVKQYIETARVLLELREVDDERNDEHVEVAIYAGKDALVVDAEGDAVPWQSQRIDENIWPQYLRGRIVNGELITEPADVTLNAVLLFPWRPVLLRGAQLRLRLTETGAEGLRTGYVDAASWWGARATSVTIGSITGDSPPSLYEALYRLADGYKDPKTGACTALSSATRLEFVRASLGHSNKEDME